jgi:hypothetical protein
MSATTIMNSEFKQTNKMEEKKVLEPCNISEIYNLDVEKLKKSLSEDYLTPGRQKFYKSTASKNLNLEDSFMEWIVSESMGGERIGEGHYPIDIVKDNIGIDVFCLCLSSKYTNEKSVMQNFAECGNNLDVLFDQEKKQDAIDLYKKRYYNKLNKAINDHNLTKLFYLGFISTDKSIYLSVFKINLDAILKIQENGMSRQKKSINFINFIDPKLGKTKCYKSKKRMEIRFSKDLLTYDNTIEIYNLDNTI